MLLERKGVFFFNKLVRGGRMKEADVRHLIYRILYVTQQSDDDGLFRGDVNKEDHFPTLKYLEVQVSFSGGDGDACEIFGSIA